MTPWMDKTEIDLIISKLRLTDKMLEYGSGGSTTIFSKYVSKYYSIEHVENWHDDVSKELISQELTHIDYHLVKPDYPRTIPTKYEEFKTYIEYPKNFNVKFDKVLVDGRGRQYCAEFIIPYLHKNSIVFIHDYFTRPQYHLIEQWYNVIDSVKNTTQTIVALSPKREYVIKD